MRIAASGLLVAAGLLLTGPAAAAGTGGEAPRPVADLSSIAVSAVPGTLGLVALTGLGALLGYRQAKAGRTVRGGGSARFLDGG